MAAFFYWGFLRAADTCITLVAEPSCTPTTTSIDHLSHSPTPAEIQKRSPNTHENTAARILRFLRDLRSGLTSAFAADGYEAVRITIQGAQTCLSSWVTAMACEALRSYVIPGWDGEWTTDGGWEITIRLPGPSRKGV